jgi:trimeric autotransporter adhesin
MKRKITLFIFIVALFTLAAGLSASQIASVNVQVQGINQLPSDGQASISAAIGRDQVDYHATANTSGIQFTNPSQNLTASFGQGVIVTQNGATWQFALREIGYGATRYAVNAAQPQQEANRVEYSRGALTEWYVNGPAGLEQGFTLNAPTGESNGEPLTLALDLAGDLTATLDSNARGLTLVNDAGAAVLRYAGLLAYDAAGQDLDAWLELEQERLLVRVDDANAQYPIVIDPIFEKARLSASDTVGGDAFGESVAISANGVIVVGARYHEGKGAAYVFLKPASGWVTTSTFNAKLTATDGFKDDWFGRSVSITAQGDTIVVGASAHNLSGAAYVFEKPGVGWSGNLSESAKLTASDGAENDRFGKQVAINESGDTVVVGAPYASVNNKKIHGATYVFVKSGSSWSGALTESAKLTPAKGKAYSNFGEVVSISGDTVVAGAPWADVSPKDNRGAAYVFEKPGGGWNGNVHENARLTASDGIKDDLLGYAIATRGSMIVVGAPYATHSGFDKTGAVYVFIKPSGGWNGNLNQNAKLVASDPHKDLNFGNAVAVNGNFIAVGAYGQNAMNLSRPGAVYLFVKPKSGWNGTRAEKIQMHASDRNANDWLGWSVALAKDVVVGGAPYANDDKGAAYLGCVKPAKPKLVSPKQGKKVGKPELTLDWSDPHCAYTYTLVIRRDAKNGPLHTKEKGLQVSQADTKGLVSGATYYWRVSACNRVTCTSSVWRSFSVK